MNPGSVPRPLLALDQVLDWLHTAVAEPGELTGDVRRYVEDAVDAAMAASGRARDNQLHEPAARQIRETTATARALLEALHATRRSSRTIMDHSLDLRRHARRLTAAVLAGCALRLPGFPGAAGIGAEGPLHGVRIILVDPANLPGEAMLRLSALGAQVEVAHSAAHAVAVARTFAPDALVCDLAPSAAEALVCELRHCGVVAPALAVAAADDRAALEACRGAGFAGVLVGPLALGALVRAIRAALGA